jgi:UDP-N-acetylmuramyl pentapeptide synthase
MKTRILHLYYTILARLARHYLRRHQPKIIGINGSVGKTSCRMIIFQTLQQFFPDKKISTSPKNFNGELGLSLSILEITEREPNITCLILTFFKCL